MIDIRKPIPIDDSDMLRITVSAHIQSFTYDIKRYLPDGNGGFQPGHLVALGDDETPRCDVAGATLHGARVKVCTTHGGHTETSQYEIRVDFQIERSSGELEGLTTLRIAPGLESGEYRCLTLQFQ